MAQIKIEKPQESKLKQMDVFSWPIREKEVSRFDWYYNDQETCYLLEGEVEVETKDGNRVSFSKGDLVTFPKGLSCIWDIKAPVRKHYKFG